MPIPGKKTSVILQSVTKGQSSTTGKNEVSTTVIATFKAAFHPVRALEMLLFDKETVVATHKLRVDHSTLGDTVAAQLVEENQIIVDSITYDITGVVEWDTNPSHHYRVDLRATDVDN